jgi:capsid protein
LSQVNYSSIRAGIVEFRRIVEAIQWQLVIPVFCQPIWDWFSEAAYVAGLVPTPRIAVNWSPPRFEYLNPLDDARADLMMMRMGANCCRASSAAMIYDACRNRRDERQIDARISSTAIRESDQQGLYQQEPRLMRARQSQRRRPDQGGIECRSNPSGAPMRFRCRPACAVAHRCRPAPSISCGPPSRGPAAEI